VQTKTVLVNGESTDRHTEDHIKRWDVVVFYSTSMRSRPVRSGPWMVGGHA